MPMPSQRWHIGAGDARGPSGNHRRVVRARTIAAAVLAAALAAAAAGCGGTTTRTVREAAVQPAPPVDSLPQAGLDPHVLPPRRVPTHGTRPADPAARRVIETWLRALRAGHLRAAAHLFAVPSTFQNATPVMHLRTARQVRAVVAGFPCGAVATRFAASGSYTLVRFTLTERVGGDCHGAAGNTTGGAIRVAHGRIVAWYRLYDPEEIHPTGPLVDPGNLAE
jgi:limonene-1,2-epoxide hydrolase